MLERGGELVTTFVKSRHLGPMTDFIQSQILPGTTVRTDEFGSYGHLDACGFDHETVSHQAGQCATA